MDRNSGRPPGACSTKLNTIRRPPLKSWSRNHTCKTASNKWRFAREKPPPGTPFSVDPPPAAPQITDRAAPVCAHPEGVRSTGWLECRLSPVQTALEAFSTAADSHRAVAQLGRAPRSGRGGRGFESLRPDHSVNQRFADGTLRQEDRVQGPPLFPSAPRPAVKSSFLRSGQTSRRTRPPAFRSRKASGFGEGTRAKHAEGFTDLHTAQQRHAGLFLHRHSGGDPGRLPHGHRGDRHPC